MLLAKKLRIAPLTFVLTMAFTCLDKWTIFLLIILLGILGTGQIPTGTTCSTQLDGTFSKPFLLVPHYWMGSFLCPSSLSHLSRWDLFQALPPCPTQLDRTFFKPFLLVPHIWMGPFLSPSSLSHTTGRDLF